MDQQSAAGRKEKIGDKEGRNQDQSTAAGQQPLGAAALHEQMHRLYSLQETGSSAGPNVLPATSGGPQAGISLPLAASLVGTAAVRASPNTAGVFRLSPSSSIDSGTSSAAQALGGSGTTLPTPQHHPLVLESRCSRIARLRGVELPSYVREHGSTLTFPEKLMLMIVHIEKVTKQQSQQSAVVSVSPPVIGWLDEHGTAIVIRDSKTLVEEWLPQFIGKTKFSSFTRKLYRWGFRQLTLQSNFPGEAGGSTTEPLPPPGSLVFACDNFQRNNMSLLTKMRSVTARDTRRAEKLRQAQVQWERDKTDTSEAGSSDGFGRDSKLAALPVAPGTGLQGAGSVDAAVAVLAAGGVPASSSGQLFAQNPASASAATAQQPAIAPSTISAAAALLAAKPSLQQIGASPSADVTALLRQAMLHQQQRALQPQQMPAQQAQQPAPQQQQRHQYDDVQLQVLLQQLATSSTAAANQQQQQASSSLEQVGQQLLLSLLQQQPQQTQSTSVQQPASVQPSIAMIQQPQQQQLLFQQQPVPQVPPVAPSSLLSSIAAASAGRLQSPLGQQNSENSGSTDDQQQQLNTLLDMLLRRGDAGG